jgi:nucleoside-diphosphate-sugar epimerase
MLSGVKVVVHLAARVHVMQDRVDDPLATFREVNTAGTLALAQQAADAGTQRFVFVSSIKVNGERTELGQAYRHDDRPAPQDPYGVSKREAEDGLRAIGIATGLEVVVVRPPLVYGPGVRANFAAFMRALQRGLPLPLGSITDNRRSFVALDNLLDLLVTCLDHPAAANQTFLVSDGEDLSTTELLHRLGRAMNRPPRLIPVPTALLYVGAALLGRREQAQRLMGNLQIDIDHTRTTLGWTPPVSVDEGLRRAAQGFRP